MANNNTAAFAANYAIQHAIMQSSGQLATSVNNTIINPTSLSATTSGSSTSTTQPLLPISSSSNTALNPSSTIVYHYPPGTTPTNSGALHHFPPHTVVMPGTTTTSTTLPSTSLSTMPPPPPQGLPPTIAPATTTVVQGPPTIPSNLVTQAQQISSRTVTPPILPNIPTTIPLQLMDRVTGKNRIRSIAKLFYPGIELEDGAIELIDELMGKLVEDWTFMASQIARIRMIPSTDSGLPMGTNVNQSSSLTNPLSTASSTITTGSVPIPVGNGINGGHPVLEASDFHTYISQVYPFLTLPTENITNHIIPKPPPSYASMESLVAKQRLALLPSVSGTTGTGSTTTALPGGNTTGSGTTNIPGTNDTTKLQDYDTKGDSSSNTNKTTKGNKEEKDSNKMTLLSLKKRGRPPKNPSVTKLSGTSNPMAKSVETVGSNAVSSSGSTNMNNNIPTTTSSSTTTGTTSDKPLETKKLSLVLGKTPSFGIAGSSTNTPVTNTGTSISSTSSASTTAASSKPTNVTTSSSTTSSSGGTTGGSTGPRLLLRIGGSKPSISGEKH